MNSRTLPIRLSGTPTLLSWLAAVVVTVALTIYPAAPAAAQARYTFLQFNMAGNMNHVGLTEIIVPAVVRSITSTWPSAVSLNEVCKNQFDAIYWIINGEGGGYHGYFAETRPQDPERCGGLAAYGLALLIKKGNPASFGEQLLPDGLTPEGLPTEPRKVICGNALPTLGTPRLRVCSSHLQGGSDVKYKQMTHITQRHLIPAAQRGEAIAFMGDTYLTPDQMIFFTGGGLFKHTALGYTSNNPNCTATESAKRLRPLWAVACETHELKYQYDYVMVANAHNIDGAVTTTQWSDHLPVRGAATFG